MPMFLSILKEMLKLVLAIKFYFKNASRFILKTEEHFTPWPTKQDDLGQTLPILRQDNN